MLWRSRTLLCVELLNNLKGALPRRNASSPQGQHHPLPQSSRGRGAPDGARPSPLPPRSSPEWLVHSGGGSPPAGGARRRPRSTPPPGRLSRHQEIKRRASASFADAVGEPVSRRLFRSDDGQQRRAAAAAEAAEAEERLQRETGGLSAAVADDGSAPVRPLSPSVDPAAAARLRPLTRREAAKEAVAKELSAGRNPFRGYEGCGGTDGEAAAVILTMGLRKAESEHGRRQVAVSPSEAAMLPRTLRRRLQVMEKFGYEIGVATHRACLYVLKQHLLYNQSRYWLGWMEKEYGLRPDAACYNTVMSCAVKGCPSDVPTLYAEMRAAGVAATDATFAVLLQASAYEAGPRILAAKAEQGLAPSAVDYNTLVGKAPDFTAAKVWVDALLREGFAADKFTVGGLLKVCARHGDVAGAQWAVSLAKRGRVRLSTTLYTALLSVYAHSGDVAGFQGTWKLMRQGGMRPNQHTYLTKVRMLSAAARRPGDAAMQELEATVTAAQLASCLSSPLWEAVFDVYAKVSDVAGAQKMGAFMAGCMPRLTPGLQEAYRRAALEVFSERTSKRDGRPSTLWVTASKEQRYALGKTKPREAVVRLAGARQKGELPSGQWQRVVEGKDDAGTDNGATEPRAKTDHGSS
eukprot:Rhum_TRINITY_DN13338_c0_g1::Rhum_TRINITY_DN13338_c0_g1_i1::g.59352::m.59352